MGRFLPCPVEGALPSPGVTNYCLPQTWTSVPFRESAPQESAPTLLAPSPAGTATRATGPAPWATPVKVRAPHR